MGYNNTDRKYIAKLRGKVMKIKPTNISGAFSGIHKANKSKRKNLAAQKDTVSISDKNEKSWTVKRGLKGFVKGAALGTFYGGVLSFFLKGAPVVVGAIIGGVAAGPVGAAIGAAAVPIATGTAGAIRGLVDPKSFAVK